MRKRLYGIEQDPMEIWSTKYAAMLEVIASRGCPLNTWVYVKRFGILANFIRFITVTCTRHNPWFPVPIRFPWSK